MLVLITTQKIEIMAAQKAKPEKLEYDQWMFGWCACKRAPQCCARACAYRKLRICDEDASYSQSSTDQHH